MKSVQQWMDDGEYLPEILRDFHDQKNLFKAMHDIIDVGGHGYAKSVNWMVGQCYVVDIFLWFMARRGYTLQRTRRQGNYNDIHADISDCTERRHKSAAATMLASFKKDPT